MTGQGKRRDEMKMGAGVGREKWTGWTVWTGMTGTDVEMWWTKGWRLAISDMMEPEPLIPKHGGYRKLKSFQIAQLCYDVTVRFCDRYIEKRSRTHDQMVQAARSGVQNIAEGSKASGTSKKMELKLTNVARASLEELRLDYEDFLRQGALSVWPEGDSRRKELVGRRCATVEEVAVWVREVRGRDGRDGQRGDEVSSNESMPSSKSISSEIAANAALVLIGVACALLDRQIEAQAAAFTRDGGFTERMHRIRTETKGRGYTGTSSRGEMESEGTPGRFSSTNLSQRRRVSGERRDCISWRQGPQTISSWTRRRDRQAAVRENSGC
jgi:four helix bundle suffix protein